MFVFVMKAGGRKGQLGTDTLSAKKPNQIIFFRNSRTLLPRKREERDGEKEEVTLLFLIVSFLSSVYILSLFYSHLFITALFRQKLAKNINSKNIA